MEDGRADKTPALTRTSSVTSAIKTRSSSTPGEGAKLRSESISKKSVRWSIDNEPVSEPTAKSLPLKQLSVGAFFVGLSGIIIAVETVFDFGLVYAIERFSRLAVPGICVAFVAHRMSVHLEDDRMKLRSFVVLSLACFASEAITCLLVGDTLPTWFFSFVVFFAVAMAVVLTSVNANQVALTVVAVVLVRYFACAIFVTLPQSWRPLLGYGFVLLGILMANSRTLRSECQKLVAGLHVSNDPHTVVNDVRKRMVENSSHVMPNRRISLPIIKKPTEDTLNSRFLRKAESTINQLLTAPGVPEHIHSQLQMLSELLRLPDAQETSFHTRRSKSIPQVMLSGASVLSKLCSDLPYTLSEESSFAPKRIRRHFSVAGYGHPSGLWTQNFLNSSSDSNYYSPSADWVNAEEKYNTDRHRYQLLQNGRRSSDTSCPGSMDSSSRILGEATQDKSPSEESPSRKSSSSSNRSSLRISFADKPEVISYDSNDEIILNSSEPEVSEVESEDLKKLLDEEVFNQWNYPIFDLALEAPDTLLSKVAYKIFTELDLMETFEIPKKEFVNFFHEIERGYHENPYHNRIHATDVLHAVYYMTTQQIYGFMQVIPSDDYGPQLRTTSLLSSIPENGSGGIMGANFLALELMAMLTAAALHDYDHPGRTNAFLIATCHPLAVLYNNRSVLENHHAAASWSLLISDPKYAWLVNLNDAEFKRFRYLVIDEILVTDLVQHFTIVSDFKSKFLSSGNSDNSSDDMSEIAGSQIDWTSEDHRLVVSRVVIKMADISGPCKSWQLHKQWTDRIAEEFYRQGDDERRMQLSVSPYMDRNRPQLAKLQESFITHLVAPLCNSLGTAGLLPSFLPSDCNADTEDDEATSNEVVCLMTKHISENYQEWERLMKSENKDGEPETS